MTQFSRVEKKVVKREKNFLAKTKTSQNNNNNNRTTNQSLKQSQETAILPVNTSLETQSESLFPPTLTTYLNLTNNVEICTVTI